MNSYVIQCIFVSLLIFFIYNFLGRKALQNQKKYVQFIVIILFSLIMTFHPEDIKDVSEYERIFEQSSYIISNLSQVDVFNKVSGFEVGFVFIASLFKQIFGSIRWMYFFISLFNVTFTPLFLSKLVNKSEIEVGSVRCAYIIFYGILYNAIAVRAGLAITLGIASLYFLKKARYLLMIAMLFAAFLIQRSTIIFVLFCVIFYFWGNIPKQKTANTIWKLAAIEFLLLPLNIGDRLSSSLNQFLFSILNFLKLTSYYYGHVNTMDTALGITKYLICLAIVLVLFLVDYSQKEVPFSFLIIAMISLNIIILFTGVRAMSRLYDMGLMLMIPILCLLQPRKNGDKRLLAYVGFWSVYILFFIVDIKVCFF